MTSEHPFRFECSKKNDPRLWNTKINDQCPGCGHTTNVHSFNHCDMCQIEENLYGLWYLRKNGLLD